MPHNITNRPFNRSDSIYHRDGNSVTIADLGNEVVVQVTLIENSNKDRVLVTRTGLSMNWEDLEKLAYGWLQLAQQHKRRSPRSRFE